MKYLLSLFVSLVMLSSFGQKTSVFTTESGRVDYKTNDPLELIKAGLMQLKGAFDTTNIAMLS
ncbi:MAG: hypothetical protein H0S84_13910 [Bacteroidales bacterium]|nr:hypothetical protein [Bacteroidales bacterium]